MEKRYLLELVQKYNEPEKGFGSYAYISAKRIGLEDKHTIRVHRFEDEATIKEKTTFTKFRARRVYNNWLKKYNVINSKGNKWQYAYDIMGPWESFLTHLSLRTSGMM